jgi:hypothetical protein
MSYIRNKTKCGAYKAADGDPTGDSKEENCRNCAYFSSASCANDLSFQTGSLVDLYL